MTPCSVSPEGVDCCSAAPLSQTRERANTSGAATCSCFPANQACPGEARCGQGHPGYLRLLDELRGLHKVKSGGYGTGSDPMANFTAVAAVTGEPRYLYPVLRSIEKLTRVISLHASGRVAELGEEFLDVSSLLLCAEAMRREDAL